MSDVEKKETKSEPLWLLIAAVSFVACVFCGYSYWIGTHIPDGEDLEKARAARGQFGDAYGAVNALFSSLAFAVLIYTMWLQRKELRLQREELAETREEMKLARREAKRQADTSTRTAVIGAVSALWEHHHAIEASSGKRFLAREKAQINKLELSRILQNLLLEVATENGVVLRSALEIKAEIVELRMKTATVLEELCSNRNYESGAKIVWRATQMVNIDIAKYRFYIDPASDAARVFKQLSQIVRDGPVQSPSTQKVTNDIDTEKIIDSYISFLQLLVNTMLAFERASFSVHGPDDEDSPVNGDEST